MASFNYKNRNVFSVGPHLPGLLFIAAGLFAIASPFLIKSDTSTERALAVGGGALLLGIMILTTYEGTIIDFTGKRVKAYVAVSGFRIGRWSQLSEINTIKLLQVVQKVTNKPNGISPTLSGNLTLYKVLLYAGNGIPKHTFFYTDKARATREAQQLADKLNAVLEQNFTLPSGKKPN